jgi:hypothetical protein
VFVDYIYHKDIYRFDLGRTYGCLLSTATNLYYQIILICQYTYLTTAFEEVEEASVLLKESMTTREISPRSIIPQNPMSTLNRCDLNIYGVYHKALSPLNSPRPCLGEFQVRPGQSSLKPYPIKHTTRHMKWYIPLRIGICTCPKATNHELTCIKWIMK